MLGLPGQLHNWFWFETTSRSLGLIQYHTFPHLAMFLNVCRVNWPSTRFQDYVWCQVWFALGPFILNSTKAKITCLRHWLKSGCAVVSTESFHVSDCVSFPGSNFFEILFSKFGNQLQWPEWQKVARREVMTFFECLLCARQCPWHFTFSNSLNLMWFHNKFISMAKFSWNKANNSSIWHSLWNRPPRSDFVLPFCMPVFYFTGNLLKPDRFTQITCIWRCVPRLCWQPISPCFYISKRRTAYTEQHIVPALVAGLGPVEEEEPRWLPSNSPPWLFS